MKKWQFLKLGVPMLLLIVVVLTAVSVVAIQSHAAAAWQTYKSGSSGEDVTSIQYMLRDRGYTLTADGQFGAATEKQVKSFQSKNGLTADGIVGSLTWEKLIVTTKNGSSGDAVIALQRQLNAHGAKVATDGQFGALTAQAVKSFQSKNGLTADSIAGAQTWQALIGNASPPPPPPSPTGKLAKVVSTAKAIENGTAEPGWKGGKVPYAWGGGHGKNPGPSLGTCTGYTGSIHPCPANKTVGVDCSGFTRWVYSIAYGSDVLGSGGTSVQIKKFHKISLSEAQPGDLVYFGKSTTDTHHVGIYIGNGKMIDALETGTYVRTDNLTASSGFLGYFHYNG